MQQISIKNILVPIGTFIYLSTLQIMLFITSEFLDSLAESHSRKDSVQIILEEAGYLIAWLLMGVLVAVYNKRQYDKDKRFIWAIVGTAVLFIGLSVLRLDLIMGLGGVIIGAISTIISSFQGI